MMVEIIKKKSVNKICNMHFIIGDVIVRNVAIFQGQEQSRFFTERNQSIV
jgi:hypothetical protein